MTAPIILIVEDNPEVRCWLCEVLQREGYVTLSAGDGREALNLLDTSNVGLVLSDLEMPGMDGRELLRRLRAHPKHAKLPVVLMLTYPWDALNIQSDTFLFKLVKPLLQIADLLATLQNVIGPL